MHVSGTCALRLMQIKKAPGPELKKEDKEAPATLASKEDNAAIPSALNNDVPLVSVEPEKYRAVYCKTGLCLKSCAYSY